MSDILGPEEVDELRPANEPKYLMMGTNTWRLIQTIDALAEALRAVAKFSNMNTHVEIIDPCKYMEAEDAANVAVARVTTWLEET